MNIFFNLGKNEENQQRLLYPGNDDGGDHDDNDNDNDINGNDNDDGDHDNDDEAGQVIIITYIIHIAQLVAFGCNGK